MNMFTVLGIAYVCKFHIHCATHYRSNLESWVLFDSEHYYFRY